MLIFFYLQVVPHPFFPVSRGEYKQKLLSLGGVFSPRSSTQHLSSYHLQVFVLFLQIKLLKSRSCLDLNNMSKGINKYEKFIDCLSIFRCLAFKIVDAETTGGFCLEQSW